MKVSKVSIIVPVYNCERYLKRCVDSILAQTFPDIEVILVDDGSPDGSGAICDEYAKRDERVVVIHKENGGVSSARNMGLDRASGEYIMFCDSDDCVSPEWVEKLYHLVSRAEVDWAFCGYQMVSSEDGSLISEHPIKELTETVPGRAFWELKKRYFFNMPWNKVFKKEMLDRFAIRFDGNVSYNEDLIFNLRYLKVCKKRIGMCEEPLYYYTLGKNDSLTHRFHANYWEIKKRCMEELRESINECGLDFSEIKQEYYTSYASSVVYSIQINNMKENPEKGVKRYLKCCEILHSDECRKAFSKGQIVDVHPVYRMVLKTRCYFLVWLFQKAVAMKHMLIRD